MSRRQTVRLRQLTHEHGGAGEVVGREVLSRQETVGQGERHAAPELVGRLLALDDDIVRRLGDGGDVTFDVGHESVTRATTMEEMDWRRGKPD